MAQITRPLPWRPAATSKRSTEQVRPIFWSNRPRAYIKRTADWDSYPSGRWGNAASPAYGTLSDYQFMRRHTGSEKRAEKAKAAWGTSLTSLQDVYEVFTKYTSGNSLAVHLAITTLMVICAKQGAYCHWSPLQLLRQECICRAVPDTFIYLGNTCSVCQSCHMFCRSSL